LTTCRKYAIFYSESYIEERTVAVKNIKTHIAVSWNSLKEIRLLINEALNTLDEVRFTLQRQEDELR